MGRIKTSNETKTFSILHLRPLDESEDWSAQGGRRFQRPLMPKAVTFTRVLIYGSPSNPCGSWRVPRLSILALL